MMSTSLPLTCPSPNLRSASCALSRSYVRSMDGFSAPLSSISASVSRSSVLNFATKIASLGKARFFVTKFRSPDLETLAELLDSGALKPAIDRTYELAEAEAALRTFGEGHVRGKLVLTM